MADIVIDTQIAVWYFENSAALSADANAALDNAFASSSTVYLPSISIVEIIYLVEKAKLPPTTLTSLESELSLPQTNFRILSLTKEISFALAQIPRSIVPDMPDRIVAACGLHLGIPLVSSDGNIRKLTNIQTVW